MKKHLLFAALLTMLIFASCLAVGESTEPASNDSVEKQFDVTKAVKLEGGVNDIGVVPDGYVLVSFTLYTPETYTGEEKADFRLEGVDPQNKYYYFFEDMLPSEEPITDEMTEAADSTEETQENLPYSLICSTENIDYYIQDHLPEQQIPHMSKDDYTLSELASDIIEILRNSDIEILLNTAANLFVGTDHKNSEYLDLDHNRKLNVIICYDPDLICDGYVDWRDVANNLDCFYLNLVSLKSYVEQGYDEDSLEIGILSAFVHEYIHIIQSALNENVSEDDFIIEGFANMMTTVVNHAQDQTQIAAEMHVQFLFEESLMSHPKDGQWTLLDYTFGGRFWYYMYLMYHLDEPFPYRNTLEKMVTMNDIDLICDELAGKAFKDLYREFLLSVFAGIGVDFGHDVIPFSAAEDIYMDNATLIQVIYNYYCGNTGYNIYRYENSPIDIEGLPGCSFVIAEWDQCPKTFIFAPSDDHVETWVFALAV